MKKVFKRNVDEKIVNAMQRLDYEFQTARDNIVFMLDTHRDTPDFLDSPIFKKYEEKELQAKIAFESAKNDFGKIAVPDELKEHTVTWNLNYDEKVVTIEKDCDCEVEVCENSLKNITRL